MKLYKWNIKLSEINWNYMKIICKKINYMKLYEITMKYMKPRKYMIYYSIRLNKIVWTAASSYEHSKTYRRLHEYEQDNHITKIWNIIWHYDMLWNMNKCWTYVKLHAILNNMKIYDLFRIWKMNSIWNCMKLCEMIGSYESIWHYIVSFNFWHKRCQQ